MTGSGVMVRHDMFDEDERRVRAFWRLVRRRRSAILRLSAAFAAMAALGLWLWPDVYRAEATIMVEARDPKVVSIEEVYDRGAGQTEYLYTQYEVIKSRELAEKVLDQLDLLHRPGFGPASFWPHRQALTDDALRQEALRWFGEQLEVAPVRSTQLVKVAFRSPDPQLSADIVNTLTKVYIENELASRLDMTRQAASWINSRIEGLREQLERSEKELQAYRERENLLEVEGVRTLATQELNELTTKLVEARRQRTQAANIVAQIDQDASSNPAVLQNPLVQRLKEQETLAQQKLAELSKRYGPLHPKIIATNGELDAARNSYQQQMQKVTDGVRREYEIARATEESLLAALNKMKGEMQDINRKEYRLNELERAVAINRQLYDTFLSRMKETSETESLPTVHARIIDRAIAPNEPDQPLQLVWFAVLCGLGVVLSVVWAGVREWLDDSIGHPDDVRERLDVPLLGVLPLLKRREQAASAAVAFGRGGSRVFAESIRTLRTNLLVGEHQQACKVILVTSAVPGEGKSVTASNLAMAFGQVGKTLLVDADLRRPSAARHLGLVDGAPGLASLLAGGAELAACVQTSDAHGMDVLPAGPVPANPLELLSSPRFAALMATLRERYDHIIVDSAPCEAVSDALALSARVDGVIYVVRAGVTPGRAVQAGLARLRDAGAAIRGVVLNHVDIEKGLRAGIYYSAYLHAAYGAEQLSADNVVRLPGSGNQPPSRASQRE